MLYKFNVHVGLVCTVIHSLLHMLMAQSNSRSNHYIAKHMQEECHLPGCDVICVQDG